MRSGDHSRVPAAAAAAAAAASTAASGSVVGVGHGQSPPHSALRAIAYAPGTAAQARLLTTVVSTAPVGLRSCSVTCLQPAPHSIPISLL